MTYTNQARYVHNPESTLFVKMKEAFLSKPKAARNARKHFFLSRLVGPAAVVLLAVVSVVQAQPTTITIQAGQPGKPISPELLGIFFEDLNYAADSGLYAELIQNRSFEYSPTEQSAWHPLSFGEHQKRGGGDGSVGMSGMRPIHENNPHYAILTVRTAGEGVGIANRGFGGIPLKAGEIYEVSFGAYQAYMGVMWGEGDRSKPMPVTVRLETKDGSVLAEAKVEIWGRKWRKVSAKLSPTRTVNDARLVLLTHAQGGLCLDMVSLFPEKTFCNWPNGLRADLAQALADLKPRFVRFPGGCLVHAGGIRRYYNWKDTIGPVEQRHARPNDAWGYHQSMGLGYFEYFQLCKDIGAKSIPVVMAGVCCQHAGSSPGRGQEGLPLEEMPVYIQDVLDLIEWANGPASSKWGAKRAAAGHPDPFGLKYLGVGNEEAITPICRAPFKMIYEALKEKHPEIVVIGTSGPFASGSDFDNGWAFARKLNLAMVDEPYYVSSQWFWDNLRRYDQYDRNGPRVYVGEYAAHDRDRRRNTLRSAIAEAAGLTSLESNVDIVQFASYAPLLARRGHTQWHPDLIYFNGTDVFLTANDYVQQLFGQNSGDVYLETTIEAASSPSTLAASTVRDSQSGDQIVKIVNGGGAPAALKVNLVGLPAGDRRAIKTVLTGPDADAYNQDGQPPVIQPVTSEVTVKPSFDYDATANALTVFRIVAPATPVAMPSLSAVRLGSGPFADALKANRTYLLALEPDRLLAPFLREAGLEPKARPYGNWESSGLDGHMAGHYLSALATMIASGADIPEGELKRRLDYMVSELDRCQQASGDGYLGGVPGGRALWQDIAGGRIRADGFGLNGKWVPWYNLHKTFAGLRDAFLIAGNAKAREILIRYGDWCDQLVTRLTDEQMQDMLRAEHGGMNEVLADIYAITGDEKYLRLARRFCHKEVLDPLMRHEDQLTGKHANTQIPKVVGLARIAALTGDQQAHAGAHYFWENVTSRRCVAFGGNSVSEHFNDPKDFGRMLEHREGPETCNTYNMLQLTKQLFAARPGAAYADYYERALYNHILASINIERPGFVYFTPIRPQHYRVYSQPDKCFWCCVGTGIENPGRYGEFIYALATNGLYVNLFIPSELTATNLGLTLRQETAFPDEPRTRLTLQLKQPAGFTLYLRHPGWVAAGDFAVRVNGKPVTLASTPSSYAALRRQWRDGDRVEMELPMRTTIERLPDGSDWVAILHGPIVLAAPAGTNDLVGLFADDSRMGHVAHGPLVPLDRVPVLLARASDVPRHVKPDPATGPLCFRLVDIVEPPTPAGVLLIPFFRLHNSRYQMYWQLTTTEALAARRERIAAAERARALREANTLDWVAPGEQQPEVEHDFVGQNSDSGLRDGRRWRRGEWFQYSLNTRGERAVELVVTYWGGDAGRGYDLLVNGQLLATEMLDDARPGQFIEKRYPIPARILDQATNGRVTVRFAAKSRPAAGVYDVRLMKPAAP